MRLETSGEVLQSDGILLHIIHRTQLLNLFLAESFLNNISHIVDIVFQCVSVGSCVFLLFPWCPFVFFGVLDFGCAYFWARLVW